uniref:Asteroid domain-containing protein n=2 Tax=Clytia hemisphaerica TaxID=252671 RepID=A0A7M5XB73_9CNID
MDGGKNLAMKGEEILEREKKKAQKHVFTERNFQANGPYRVTGQFTKILFFEVMKEEEVKFIVCDEEADLMTAAVANQLGGYVVSNDADFFLYEVGEGIINFNSFYYGNYKAYKYEKLARCLNMRADLFPLLALILGNDYSEANFLKKIQEKLNLNRSGTYDGLRLNMEKIVQYMKSKESLSCEKILQDLCGGDADMFQKLRKELSEFTVSTLQESAKKNLDGNQHKSIKDIFNIDNIRADQLVDHLVKSGFLLGNVSDLITRRISYVTVHGEDVAEKPAALYSIELRKCLYSLLLGKGKEVTEYSRKSGKFSREKITLLTDQPRLMELVSKNEDERRSWLFCVLGVQEDEIKKLDGKTNSLILMALKFYSKEFTNLHKNDENIDSFLPRVIRAFLCMHIYMTNEKTAPASPQLELHLVHTFNCFQTILFYISILNTLVGRPFGVPETGNLLSIGIFHFFFKKEKGKLTVKGSSSLFFCFKVQKASKKKKSD